MQREWEIERERVKERARERGSEQLANGSHAAI